MISEPLLYFKNLKTYILQAKYLHGVPNMNDNFTVKFEPKVDGIAFIDSVTDKEKFQFKRADIVRILVEDQSALESRVGLKRLLLVGVFAFAWKKKEKIPLSFLVFEYKNEFGEIQEVYFQSDRPTGFQDFTNIKYNLQKFWKEADENPNFQQVIQKTESEILAIKDIEQKGCRTSFIALIIFAIIVLLVMQLTK